MNSDRARSIRRHISEWEAMHGESWLLDAEDTDICLRVLNLPVTRLAELELRYLGRFATKAELVRSTYRDYADMDVTAWPLTHIDWEAASRDLAAHAPVLRVGEHWFDITRDDVYAG